MKPFGHVLHERFGVSREQLDAALRMQREGARERLGDLLIRMGALGERDRMRALAFQLGVPIALDLCRQEIPAELLHAIPATVAQRRDVFPISLARGPKGEELFLAMADPTDLDLMFEIEHFTGLKVFPVIAPRTEIRRAIALHYRAVGALTRQEADGILLIEEASSGDAGVIPLMDPGSFATTEIG